MDKEELRRAVFAAKDAELAWKQRRAMELMAGFAAVAVMLVILPFSFLWPAPTITVLLIGAVLVGLGFGLHERRKARS